MGRWFLAFGSVLGGLAVMAGAFGAHGLEERLSPEMLDVWQTAAMYQMYHAIILVVLGVWPLAASRDFSGKSDGPSPANACAKPRAAAGVCFTLGVIIFSGTLYLLAVTGVKWLGAITPIGGVLLIVGWGLLAWAGWKAARCPR